MADNGREVKKVLLIVLALNWAVSASKMTYGYMTGSVGMISDGFHSLFDGMSNIFGLVGIWLSSRPPDKEHPYGHRKYETLFTAVIAVMIFSAGFQILKRVYESLSAERNMVVNAGSYAVMGFTMAVNIIVMTYESRKGRRLGSDILLADAMHTRSDVLTSFAVILGLAFTKAGYHYADALVGMAVTAVIAGVGYRIMKRASETLVDTVRIDAGEICRIVEAIEGVKGCHDIRSRGTQQHIYIDMHVYVDPGMTVSEAHRISDRVEEKIKGAFPNVADIVVHIEPEGS